MSQAKFPWVVPVFRDWSIVGMNHYRFHGERCLYVSMTRGNICITREGPNDLHVWQSLESDARAWNLRFDLGSVPCPVDSPA